MQRSIPLRQRLADAAVFARWLGKMSIDHRIPLPHGKMADFLKESSATPLSAKTLQHARQYLRRALKLCNSGGVETFPGKHLKSTTRSGGLTTARYKNRKRRLGNQGRPHKASLVREELWRWFSSIKRSVMSRIFPSTVLAKARALLEVYTSACLKKSQNAEAPVINHCWLRGWRYEHQVSWRKPNVQ